MMPTKAIKVAGTMQQQQQVGLLAILSFTLTKATTVAGTTQQQQQVGLQ